MTPERRLIERAARGEDIRQDAAAFVEKKAAARRRKGAVRRERHAPTAEKKRIEGERERAFYENAKREAAERSVCATWPAKGPRCEVVSIVSGQEVRCPCDGMDPDHVLGGAMRKECEALGAEGLEVMCRFHHDAKHASTPSREVWLDQAQRHALKHGYRRLLTLIAKARAKYEGRHPARRSAKGEAAPNPEESRR